MRRVRAWMITVVAVVVLVGCAGVLVDAQTVRKGVDESTTPVRRSTTPVRGSVEVPLRKGFDESTTPVRIERPAPLKGADLVAEFGADLGYLENVGAEVDAGRQFGDGARLAVAARTLRKAEDVTRRTSRLVTSRGLLAEAERTVAEYEDASSAEIVADVVRALDTEGAPRADRLVEQAKAWRLTPPTRREGSCVLIIRNPTRHRVDIWVNNRYVATMGPFDTRKTSVPRGVVRLCGVGRLDPWRWGPVERVSEKQFVWLLEKP